MAILSSASAQNIDQAIFSAKIAEEVPADIQGTPFLLPSFQKADVLFNGTLYKGLLVNINALTNELHLKEPTSSQTLALSKRLTETVSTEKEEFINLQSLGMDNAPEGFFKVAYKGRNSLLYKTSKSLITVTDGLTKKVSNAFDTKTAIYLLREDGQLLKISGNRDVLKAFPSLKKEISAAVGKNLGVEEFAIATLQFLESR